MRTTRTLALLAVLASGSTAKAAELMTGPAPEATTEQAAAAPVTAPATSLPWLGLMVDAGIPDGAVGSLVLRPWKWLRTSVGGSYNMVSKGVRGGLSLLPFGRGPSLTVEAGRYFEGDANAAARKVAGPSFQDISILEKVGYDYANAHLGLDFGYKRVTFFIHGGMSYLRGTIHNADSLFQTQASIDGTDSNGLSVKVKGDPTVKVIGPSAKIGLIVYLW
jgi:hypothetical protein